jgi:hypothetical protein
MIVSMDCRDAYFQEDPFHRMLKLRGDSSERSEFFGVTTETSFLGYYDMHNPFVSMFIYKWMEETCGEHCAVYLLKNATMPSKVGEHAAVLCSGVMYGTTQAMSDVYRVMVETSRHTCPNDQGVLMLLVYGGLAATNFPHDIVISNSEYSFVRHLVQHYHHIRWTAADRCKVENCDGELFSIVHQFDRHGETFVECIENEALRELGIAKAQP